MTIDNPQGLRAKAKAATRTKVIGAAYALFERYGFHDVTMRDVAREAKLSTGAIFISFQNKVELYEAAMKTPAPVGNLAEAAPALQVALDVMVLAYRVPGVMDHEQPPAVQSALHALARSRGEA